ncbi:hypothetical protein R80B4_01693 [Fibrobacteres bacterium R8-0-B4]
MTSFVKNLAKCTVALCVLCAAVFAQPKPKAAVYIMGAPEGRDALRSAVNTFLIKSGKYQMIAVDAIDVVALEQRRQMSGAVTDGDIAALGRDAGAQYVCVVQRSELDGVSYVATRMVNVQSKVADLADIVELPPGGKVIDIIQWQIGSMLGMAVGPRPGGGSGSGSGYAARPAQSTYTAAPAQTSAAASGGEAASTIRGTLVPGGSFAQKLVWLQKSADSHETYIVEANADERIDPNNTFEFVGGINITVVLRGTGGNRTIRLKSHGYMFKVRPNVTLVLDNNITLQGHPDNTNAMILVEDGALKMNAGSAIAGNGNRGVFVDGRNSTFEMFGGTISGNGRRDIKGGGVAIDGGTFTMNGGTISGNTASNGGGVCFVGGCNRGMFNMRGGVISGNTAAESGGGLSVCGSDKFVKTGGVITGYKSDPANGNAVKDEEGIILSRKGHAIYLSSDKRKETTAGPAVNFAKDGTGAWEQ